VCFYHFICLFVRKTKLIDSACKKEKSLFLSCFGSQAEFRHKTKVSCKIAANDSHLQSFLLDLASVENFSEFLMLMILCSFFWVVTCSLGKTLNWPRVLNGASTKGPPPSA